MAGVSVWQFLRFLLATFFPRGAADGHFHLPLRSAKGDWSKFPIIRGPIFGFLL